MNLDYKIITLFSKQEVLEYRKVIESSNSWVDGIKSTIGLSENIKKNKENLGDKKVDNIKRGIASRYKNSPDCYGYTNIKTLSPPLISQMTSGEYYKTHLDSPESNYSTTLFLSEPNEYEGGELCLYLAGSVKRFKLGAGKAIIYKNGTPHCVNEIKSGKRIVSVCWITSSIQDQHDRELLYMLRMLKKRLNDEYGNFNDSSDDRCNWNNIEDANSDPYFIFKTIKHKIQTKHAVDIFDEL